ncbi:hypothetical protein C7T94_17970 [Pedobacter yulinensis]|uniref:Uncharacterized protein n=1 Tax=Pedobacter yulinensis TaxID=2126353 RepID=A0A2T3HH37_9SPHI|nr:hypothetical protein [Pedobacter yulinensis]PST81758.1 hypothetical protein C7T94_17970 [Pedobacter yulinensis]
MQNSNIQISADLQKFISKFEPSKFKLLAKGIEIRGANNLHRAVAHANDLIEKLKLNLRVNHNAEMAIYGSFEVVDLAPVEA